MIKVKDFDSARGLEYIINRYHIKREDIIDIKWAATSHCSTYGLILYEAPIESSIHEENCITSSDFTYSGFGL